MTTAEQVEAVKAYCREPAWCVMGSPWQGEADVENGVKRHVLRLLGESDDPTDHASDRTADTR